MYKAVVFDLDHTLFDRYATFKSILEKDLAYTVFKADKGADEILKEWTYVDKKYSHLFINHWDYTFDHLKSKDMILDTIQKENFFRNYIAALFGLTAIPYPDTISTLETLKNAGLKLGVITNGWHELQIKKIKMLGITDYFDEIIISRDFSSDKPDRRLFDIMAEHLDVKPEKILFVGDNPINDVDGARRAGYKTAWLNATGFWATPEIARADYEIDALCELTEILQI